MCIFDAEHMADWCYAMDRHALTGERPTYCPLVVERVNSMSQARRVTIQQGGTIAELQKRIAELEIEKEKWKARYISKLQEWKP
jgi:hypothetical protein